MIDDVRGAAAVTAPGLDATLEDIARRLHRTAEQHYLEGSDGYRLLEAVAGAIRASLLSRRTSLPGYRGDMAQDVRTVE